MLLVPTELRPSPIHGIGVFLSVPVSKGQVIWRFDSRIDHIYFDDELRSFPEHVQQFIKTYSCWHAASNTWMLSSDNERFVNHSDDPCMRTFGVSTLGDEVAVYDLPAGTELTADYREITDLPLEVYIGINDRIAA